MLLVILAMSFIAQAVAPAKPAFTLPPLPYAYDALEPYMDERTMRVHHDRHHAAYVNKLNEAIADYPELKGRTIESMLQNLTSVPEKARLSVRNNGGGHYNHSFFWQVMSPDGGGEPNGMIKRAIDKKYKSFATFKEKFIEAATKLFGSGWTWLCLDSNNELIILTTPNQDCPLSQGLTPLLVLDEWEHAYYLKHLNDRAKYINSWWELVNWPQVEKNYNTAQLTFRKKK